MGEGELKKRMKKMHYLPISKPNLFYDYIYPLIDEAKKDFPMSKRELNDPMGADSITLKACVDWFKRWFGNGK